jgi:hypothetical protein
MRRRRAILSPLIMALATVVISNSAAQPPADEWTAIYDSSFNGIVIVHPDRLRFIQLPEIPDQRVSTGDISQVAISADWRYVITTTLIYEKDDLDRDRAVFQIFINDLEDRQVSVVPSLELSSPYPFFNYWWGAFSPDQTQVALAYTDSAARFGGIAIVNLASAEVVAELIVSEGTNAGAWVDRWTEEGIWYSPRCSQCAPEHRYTYSLWEPTSDSLEETSIEYWYQKSDRFWPTGELVIAEYLLVSDPPDYRDYVGVATEPTEVLLFELGSELSTTDGAAVTPPDHEVLWANPRWIANGHGYVLDVDDTNHALAVMRDGRIYSVDYTEPQRFLSSTSDGWLTISLPNSDSPGLSMVYRHNLTRDGVRSEIVYSTEGAVLLAGNASRELMNALPPFLVQTSEP